MAYNRHLFNSALYNAGRDELGGIIKSIISAHTGPHIKAVVGAIPSLPERGAGISFISDFTIVEGSVRKPPTSFNFPDLRAVMRAVRAGQEDLALLIRAQQFFDMHACVFPVATIPDLRAIIFGLVEKDLPATITGILAQLDLGARLQITQLDLGGVINELLDGATAPFAPSLAGTVFSQYATNLGALIWTPLDLPGFIQSVQRADLPADIFAFQFSDIPGSMLGIAAPKLFARIKAFTPQELNIPAALSSRLEKLLGASITAGRVPGDELSAFLNPSKDSGDMLALLTPQFVGDLRATIRSEIEFDLPATINFLSATTLQASIGALLLGEHDLFLGGSLQPVRFSDLSAIITTHQGVANLSASIQALTDTADLSAFLRASETFVTALLTISIFNASDLRATIGRPECGGGSANAVLGATATAQHAGDLRASISSFIATDLGASINQDEIFYAIDSIQVSFTPKIPQAPTFFTTDTISVVFSPFRGLNLGAFISTVSPSVNLPATINVVRRLPRVESARNVITAAELRFDRDFDVQEIRLQLEGQLLDYFYVNGTEDAFISDAEEDWKLNIRSFREITSGLFGDFAAGRVCRLGNLTSFPTLDAAVRNCIASVIGLQGESDMSASIVGSGGVVNLPASLEANHTFNNLSALVNRVFPVDLSATITGDP